MNLGPVLLCMQVSLGVGAGVVRHEGGSSFSAFSLSPAAQHITPSFYLSAGGALSLIEQGVWATQGRVDLWAAFPRPRRNPRVALSATVAASTRSDGFGAGSGSGVVELIWNLSRSGVALGAGAAGGVIEGALPIGSSRVRARAWWQPTDQAPEFSFSAEGTRFLGAWYTDLVTGATFERPRVTASLWASARISATYGSTGALSGAVQYFLTSRIAVEASGGNYLRDPFQGLPRAGFGGVGLRLFAARHALSTPATTTPLLRPLIAQRRDTDTAVVRFRMPAAHSVAIAGTWNSWAPEPLQALGGDIWEAALRLAPGTYYFNLVVDEKEWVVPGGVATVSDGMGGWVAVLTVPPL